MKIFLDTKIYIICPAKLHTGGPESLHQLASQLISFGVETYMLYSFEAGHFNTADPVDDALKKYHVPYVFNFVDSSRNIVVMSETTSNIGLYGAKNCRHVLWWMSVDNFFENIIDILQSYLKAPLAEPVPKFFYFNKADNVEHWAQSEYVRQFLSLNGVKKIRSVETHMSQTFLHCRVDLSSKKNIVAYNPRKGFAVTEQLIKLAPDLDWRPIENMTPAQVQQLLAQAKVYIDFGNFPGRERLPREAALSSCVVITGRRGAAANDIDINIPAEFKFDERTTDAQAVIKKIREVFDNFNAALDEQKAFRDKELNAQKNFAAQVADAFGIKKFPLPTVALVQGVCEESLLLAQEFLRGNNFTPSFIVDDVLADTKISDELIIREQNRNYLRVGNAFIEIITQDDAKFLYREGRIKNFALLEPSDSELAALNDFYAPNAEDVLNVERISSD